MVNPIHLSSTWRTALIPAAGILMAGVLIVAANGTEIFENAVRQPVPFDHKKHMETDLTCLNCHTSANKEAFAGIPGVRRCIRCHESEEIDKPETNQLREYVDRGEDIPWIPVYRVPAHTFFSHRRHVAIAKLDCAVCHGDMSQATQPVTAQAIRISMDRCMDCHRQENVTNDCLACHR
jgi:hypothetical protein